MNAMMMKIILPSYEEHDKVMWKIKLFNEDQVDGKGKGDKEEFNEEIVVKINQDEDSRWMCSLPIKDIKYLCFR